MDDSPRRLEVFPDHFEASTSTGSYFQTPNLHPRNDSFRLEHVDEVLRSARLAGYLYIRTRWTALPGEPPIDDTDVDDWLPRFVVLHGPCIFFYLTSTDLSPQDTTLLSDVVEIGPLPNLIQDDEQTRYSFYILTLQGLRLECSSHSKIQVDSWLTTLQVDCKLGPDDTTACEDSSMS